MKASDLIQAMTAAGAPMEAVLIALRAIEERDDEIAARDAEATARRAKDAERKRLARVHGHSTDIPETVQAAPLSPSPNENNSNPHPHTPVDITTRARDDFPMPAWCPSAQVWRDLKANRKAKRLPCTVTAHAKLIRDIERMADDAWPPGRLLEAIVARGWAAAYDPRDERKPANDRQQRNPPTGTRTAANDAIARLTGTSGHH